MTQTVKPAWIREQLARLEEKAGRAAVKAKAALDNIGKAHDNGHQLLAKLCDYERGVRTRKPGAKYVNSEDTRRQLTEALVGAVMAGRFIAVPVDDGAPAAGVRFVDPRPSALYESLRIEAAEARAEARAFAAEHAQTLREEDDRLAAKRVRDALKGDDPAEIARALQGLPAVQPESAFTTADL